MSEESEGLEPEQILISRYEENDKVFIEIVPNYDGPSLVLGFAIFDGDEYGDSTYFDLSVTDAEKLVNHLKKVIKKLKKEERISFEYFGKKGRLPPRLTWLSHLQIEGAMGSDKQ